MTNPKHTDTSRSGDLVEAVERYVRVFTSGASDAVKYRAHMNLLGRIEAIEAIEAENKQLRREVMEDHARGCEGRNYSCTCGYDDATTDRIEALEAENERLREVLVGVAASLAAAISLLERGGKAAKKAAPSDLMFDQMVRDYTASLERTRAALGEKQ